MNHYYIVLDTLIRLKQSFLILDNFRRHLVRIEEKLTEKVINLSLLL